MELSDGSGSRPPPVTSKIWLVDKASEQVSMVAFARPLTKAESAAERARLRSLLAATSKARA